MAIAAEHLYDSCTCTNGMRNGLRCADCQGRGLVPKGFVPTGGTVAAPADLRAAEDVDDPDSDDGESTDDDTEQDELENMSVTHLRSRAKDLGVSAGGSKAALVERIKAAAAGDAGTDVNPDSDDGESTDDDTEQDET